MFYKATIKDHIRVPPDIFTSQREKAVTTRIRTDYEGYISSKLGFVIDVVKVTDIQEGIIVPGDGAAYYEATFELLTYRPEMQEVVLTKVRDIAEFGAFMTLGPADGMIHISQTMDDYVSFSKDKVLSGKESSRALRVNDKCRARVVALSYKDITNPKIGLTMRQERLGRVDWYKEEKKAETKAEEQAAKKKK
jgi:DNA-directed RNA polymerase subunit E'